MLQNLCSNHLPILLTVPLSPVFGPNERLPFLNFWKAGQNDFAFYFDSHCPSAEEYSSLFHFFAAVLFTSLTLNTLLMIWCSGQTALFLSLLAKTGLAYLPTALSVALRPSFSFQQAQHAQVFPLKPAPSCTLFAGLGSTNKSAIFLLFSSYLTLILSSPPCSLLHLSFYLNLCQKLFSLSSSFIRPQWVPGHLFLPDDDLADELARLGALLVSSAMPCSHFSLISGIHSSLFSDWRHTVSSKFFDTQVPSISTEELVLPRHTRCVLSRLRCNGHTLLLASYLSRIGRIENPSCSACGDLSSHSALSNYGLFASLALWQLAVSLQPLSQALLSCPTSGAPWSSAMPPSLGKSRVTMTTAKLKLQRHHYVTNSDVPKVVNRITSQCATCYFKISILFIYTEHYYI